MEIVALQFLKQFTKLTCWLLITSLSTTSSSIAFKILRYISTANAPYCKHWRRSEKNSGHYREKRNVTWSETTFNAVNNKEGHCVLLLSSQCGGPSVVTFANISSICLVQCFQGDYSLCSAFGLCLSPNPSHRCLVPLVYRAHGWKARVYQPWGYNTV